MRGRARGLAGVVGVAALVAVGVVIRGAVWGETLAAGDDWRVVARASPVGASITHTSPVSSGGVGALARPGDLTEVLVHRPEGSSVVLLAGVLPEGAVEVRVPAAVTTRIDAVHEVVLTDFWVIGIEEPPATVELTALDASGRAVARHRVTSPALDVPTGATAPPPADPHHLTGRRPAPTRASRLESVLTVGAFVVVAVGFAALAAWARRRRRRGDEAGGTRAEGADAMLHTRSPWT